MTLVLNLNLDIVKMYICVLEMKILPLVVQKLEPEHIDRQT